MTLFDLFINLIESFTTLIIANLVYQKKDYLKLSIFTFISFSAITFSNLLLLANNLFNIIDFFLIYSYVYSISKKKVIDISNIFITLLSIISLDIANTLTLIMFSLIYKNASMDVIILVSKIIYIVFIVLLSKLISRTHYYNKKLMIISNFTLITIVLIFGYQFESYFHHINNTTITIFLSTLMSILILLALDESQKEAKRLYEKQLQLNILEEKKNNYLLSKESIEKTSKLKHDLAHIYNSVIYEINFGNNQDAVDILTNQIKELENINKVIVTGNDIIDYCIALQSEKINEQQIRIISDALPNEIPITNEDLFIVFGNLFQNAVENCQPNPDNHILISAGVINNFFFIKIKNTIKESVLTSNPDLATSKSNKKVHGIGINTCKTIIKKYNGSIAFDEDMFFNAKIIIPLS